MDSNNGGLSPAERQHNTATDIARRKVLSAYSSAGLANVSGSEQTSSYKQAPIKTDVSKQDWNKYHSAWQDYYQKYYSEYYAKAAKQYIETEKLKVRRDENDQKLLENTHVTQKTDKELVEASLKDFIKARASKKFKLRKKSHHLIPIFSGISVVLIVLFLQYNRMIFAPIMAYISPGNTTDTGITAIDPTITDTPSAEPKLIIPKLNVNVPISFGISNDETSVMDAMNHGIAHYSIPGANALPGQVGNFVVTGHSAGDIYSNNQYKFIFSGLERLNNGDLIYVNYNSTRYTYSVAKKDTVEPTNVAALVYSTTKPVMTLITCTPLGTDRYRLLVTAEQVNPAPAPSTSTSEPTATNEVPNNTVLPSNEKSFFEKTWDWLIGK